MSHPTVILTSRVHPGGEPHECLLPKPELSQLSASFMASNEESVLVTVDRIRDGLAWRVVRLQGDRQCEIIAWETY